MDKENDRHNTFFLRVQTTSCLYTQKWVDKRLATVQQQLVVEVLIPYLRVVEQQIEISDDYRIITKTKMTLPPGKPFCNIQDKLNSLDFLNRLKLTKALLYALQILTERDVIHGAISTQTILIDENENSDLKVYIVNFKHARLAGDNHLSRHVDDYFSAPEVLEKCNISLKSDVYSLGIVLALLWGVPNMIVKSNLAKRRSESQKWVPAVNLRHLFYNMNDPKLIQPYKNEISRIISSMICIQDKRLPLDRAIQHFEKLDETIQQQNADIARKPGMNHHHFGCLSFFAKPGKRVTGRNIEEVDLLELQQRVASPNRATQTEI